MPIRMQRPMVRPANLSIARTSPKRTDAHYGSAEHAEWAEKVKKRDGYRCVDPDCKGPHYPCQKVYADHIVEVKDGGAKFDVDNGITRCASSHTSKTNRERARRQRGEVGQNKTTQQRDACGPLVSHPRERSGEGESNP